MSGSVLCSSSCPSFQGGPFRSRLGKNSFLPDLCSRDASVFSFRSLGDLQVFRCPLLFLCLFGKIWGFPSLWFTVTFPSGSSGFWPASPRVLSFSLGKVGGRGGISLLPGSPSIRRSRTSCFHSRFRSCAGSPTRCSPLSGKAVLVSFFGVPPKDPFFVFPFLVLEDFL